MYYLGF